MPTPVKIDELLVRGLDEHRRPEDEFTIRWRLVVVERNDLVGNCRQVSATHVIPQRSSRRRRVDVRGTTLGYNIVDVHCSEVNAEPREPGGVRHGRVQLRT